MNDRIEQRACELYDAQMDASRRQTDRLFGALLVVQWLAAIVLAVTVSPTTWIGATPHLHVHVLAATVLGGLLAALPVALVLYAPGRPLTRYVIAAAQMLFSGLLIHLTGGRIETHFHVFGSLAFLAFYRDWRVLVPATLVVAADHLIRGIFWPESVFGVLTAAPWRAFEHAGWVLFEDAFLVLSCVRGAREVRQIARARAEIELSHERAEALVVQRTGELEAAAGELRAAKEIAESANRAKSGFLANMSHEIRTPLTAIIGFAEAATDPAITPDTLREHLRTIRRNGDHLLALINDVLDHSKIEAGQMTVERIACSPVSIVEEVRSMMHVRAHARRVGLRVEYPEKLPATIESDPVRLRQVLLNLTGNAIKFTEAGDVTIRVEASADTDAGGARLRFAVVDTGVGMTPQQVARIFQPFTQADASTTRRFGGSGLGLSISRRLADLLGGRITVDSRAGAGSTFTLELDLGAATDLRWTPVQIDGLLPDPRAGEADAAVPTVPRRLLVAEDGIDNQRLIRLLLERDGHEVRIVENGRLAVDAALEADGAGAAPFDLILMDMQMPEMDGCEATRELRARGYRRPIVALTAHAMAEDRRRCLDAGCDDYLTKPVNRTALRQTIARVTADNVATDTTAASPAPASATPQPTAASVPDSTDIETDAAPIVSRFADDPDMAELIDGFVVRLGEILGQVRDAFAQQEIDTLARVAHQLKGAAGGYGFDPVTDAARQLELAAKAGDDLDRVRAEIDALARTIDRVVPAHAGAVPAPPRP